ncbi:MAG: hypothetical protein ACRDZ5_01705, partial [Acidimicrobiales bacterium]
MGKAHAKYAFCGAESCAFPTHLPGLGSRRTGLAAGVRVSEAAAGATPADAAADAANVATSAGAPGEAPPGGVGGVALRPILGIGDRSIIGYEVLHRPSLLDWDPLTLLERVLPLAPAVAPGVIMIPVSRVLEPELAKRLVAQATEAG